MTKRRKGPKDGGADLLSVPGMEKLDQLTREVLKVPKAEIDKRETDYKAERAKRKPA